MAVALLTTSPAACPADGERTEPLETVEVTGSRAALRKQIQKFVGGVTRNDGDLIGRWRHAICPLVVGVSDEQAHFMRHHLLEIEASARKHGVDDARPCVANLFVIVTEKPEEFIAEWKLRDPGMFRWKTREGVTRSNGAGAVRTWHNAVEVPVGPMGSRITSPVAEYIESVVVLVDAASTRNVTLVQLSDYIAMVSLSQIDATARPEGVQTILNVFANPHETCAMCGLTEWDRAFLNALYRTSYAPKQQRLDIIARMTRALAPR